MQHVVALPSSVPRTLTGKIAVLCIKAQMKVPVGTMTTIMIGENVGYTAILARYM